MKDQCSEEIRRKRMKAAGKIRSRSMRKGEWRERIEKWETLGKERKEKVGEKRQMN